MQRGEATLPPGQTGTDDHRTRPRRRGEVLRAAIFEAALAELSESGYLQFSMAKVAARARVSKASLYRRWSTKVELVVDAVVTVLPEPTTLADTGSFRGDLLALFRSVVRQLNGPTGEALRGVVSDALRDPVTAQHVRTRAQGRGISTIREVVRRGTARGEMEDFQLSDRRLEAGLAMIRHRFLWEGQVDDTYVREVVDDVLIPLLTRP